MKIIIPGGSGQVGNILARHFVGGGHEVVVLARKAFTAPWKTVLWDARSMGNWVDEMEGADVVINLAGRNVNCRYTVQNRRQILESRVDSTRVVGKAISSSKHPPRLWLQASTATIYAHRQDAPNDEHTGMIGGTEPGVPDTWKFSIEVAKAWESAMDEVPVPGTRKVKLRSAMTMSPDRDGVFDVLLRLVRFGLGGTSGDGKQYVSWIHDNDFINSMEHIIGRDELEGVINLCSPQPVPNAEFMRTLREAWGMGIGLPAAKWMLELGAIFMRTETELILKSRRVVPGRLLEHGFEFKFPDWRDAARDLCQRWKKK